MACVVSRVYLTILAVKATRVARTQVNELVNGQMPHVTAPTGSICQQTSAGFPRRATRVPGAQFDALPWAWCRRLSRQAMSMKRCR